MEMRNYSNSNRRDEFDAALALGHREYLAGRYDRAVTAYTQAIEASPRPVAYLLRAAAYQRTGENEKADADRQAAESWCSPDLGGRFSQSPRRDQSAS